jgi:hypothetical protein
MKPKNTTDPTKVYDCYAGDTNAIWFETHEWEKHGECAGTVDVDDFFGQVCALSKAPLAVLETAKEANKNFADMTQALKDSGYPVWGVDSTNDQLELSVCAGNDGKWIIAKVADFPSKCGGSSPGHTFDKPLDFLGTEGPPDKPCCHQIGHCCMRSGCHCACCCECDAFLGGNTGPSPNPSPPAPTPAPSGGSCVPGQKGPACKTDADCSSLNGCTRCAHSGFCTDQKMPTPIQV